MTAKPRLGHWAASSRFIASDPQTWRGPRGPLGAAGPGEGGRGPCRPGSPNTEARWALETAVLPWAEPAPFSVILVRDLPPPAGSPDSVLTEERDPQDAGGQAGGADPAGEGRGSLLGGPLGDAYSPSPEGHWVALTGQNGSPGLAAETPAVPVDPATQGPSPTTGAVCGTPPEGPPGQRVTLSCAQGHGQPPASLLTVTPSSPAAPSEPAHGHTLVPGK